MDVQVNGNVIRVTLSERNIKTLLLKLQTKPSERSIVRRVEGGQTLFLTVESDAEHYKNREAGPAYEEALVYKQLVDALKKAEGIFNKARGGMKDFAPADNDL